MNIQNTQGFSDISFDNKYINLDLKFCKIRIEKASCNHGNVHVYAVRWCPLAMTAEPETCRQICARIRKSSGGRIAMAADSNGRSAMDPQTDNQNGVVDRLKLLYPAVNEEKTPLPRAWSAKEKYNYIGLSQNNLRVHYKGKTPGFG